MLWCGRVERLARSGGAGRQVTAQRLAGVDERVGNGWRACLRACRYNALLWVHGELVFWTDHWQYTGCGSRETACPGGVLTLVTRHNGGM